MSPAQEHAGRQGGLPSGVASVRLARLRRQGRRGANRRSRYQSVVNRAPGHCIEEDATKHFGITFLNLLDLDSNALRQLHPQLDGARLPHRSTSNFRNFLEFIQAGLRPEKAAGSRPQLFSVAACKIGRAERRVKHLRNVFVIMLLGRMMFICNKLRDRFGCTMCACFTHQTVRFDSVKWR